MCLSVNSTNYNTMPATKALASQLSAALFAVLFGMAPGASAAPADDLKEAQKHYTAGRLPNAMEKVDGYLKALPRDAQGRFLKGLILTEQKKIPEAIQVFTGLTEDFPELPEPYNNLAVLYASQGNYDKAKSSLELAIHTHPSYATAHENLGDIYAQLASRAYDRALALDKSNTTAQVKLSMVKDLFSSQKATLVAPSKPGNAAKPAVKPEPAKVDPPKDSKPAATIAVAPTKPAPSPPANPALAEPQKAAPAAAAAPATAAVTGEEAQVAAAVEAWAKAWAAKDVKGYLAAYAPDFETPGGLTRPAWEQQRKERIEAPKKIEVTVEMKSVKVAGNEATAVFRQSYRSGAVKSNNTKTLKLAKVGDKWLIKQERAGG